MSGPGIIIRSPAIAPPIDGVDDARLGGRWSRRQGEVGIATQVAQQSDLIVQTAIAPIRKRIIQGPIAMDEAENNPAADLAQQAVPIMKTFHERLYPVDEVLFSVPVMMEMNLYITEPAVP